MRKLIVCGLLISVFLTACAAPATQPTEQANEVAALESRVAALESQLAALQETAGDEHTEDVAAGFEVALAQYVMDSAGFHGMDETLNETKTVDPGYRSVVLRVRKVVLQTAWPTELADQATAFAETLEAFAEALEADDGEQSATLATEAHEVQHDFSAAIDGWLGVGDEHGHGG
jgi:hypothetical protein